MKNYLQKLVENALELFRAEYLPTLFIGCCPQSMVPSSATIRTSHTFTTPSASLDTIISPLFDTTKLFTELLCPYKVWTHRPVRASQTDTVLSPEAEQTLVEKGCQATALTLSTCPRSV